MTRRTPLTTIAAALALALALLVAVLLPMDNFVYAADPSFDSDTDSRSIAENTPPGVNIGDPISATDTDEGTVEYGQTLTYSLGGTDAASFDIDSSTGQIITKAPLDFEGKDGYSVTVTVDDGETRTTACTPCTKTVTIGVTDEDEPPAAPIAPTVVSGPDNPDTADTDESTVSLKVVWHAPENTGDHITSYNVQYRKSAAPENDLDFKTDDIDHSGTATTATITQLTTDTSYHVRVQAVNGEGTGPWSLVGTGSTNKDGNSPPTFGTQTSLSRRVDENTPAGRNIETVVTADDANSTNLIYDLDGPDAALFDFDTRNGQIRTKSPLNHENPDCGYNAADSTTSCTYGVTVTVVDGAGGSDAIPVTITVTDTTERADAPSRPTVRATEKSSTSLDVSWKEPDNTGPPITDYDVRYRTGAGTFTTNTGVAVKGVTATISGDACTDSQNNNVNCLAPNTSYEVQVRAKDSGEGAGAWSVSGTGKTSKANDEPIFDERPHSGAGSGRNQNTDFAISRVVDENIGARQNIGRVYADDTDDSSLTYSLTGTHAASFDINASTGQIRTKAGVTYDYEGLPTSGSCDPLTSTDVGTDRCYTVTVEVRDGRDADRVAVENETADDSITLKIGLRDKNEPPSAPAVTVTSPTTTGTGNNILASLQLSWDAPDNMGPAITGYDVQYKKGSASFEDVTHSDTSTTATISSLDANTSYSVQVRAKNDEGTGAWSRLVTVKTNKDGNLAPAFTTDEVTRAVNENKANENVGDVVAHDGTTDTDSSTFTYSLEGPDANLFTVSRTTGQIKTKSSLNHENPDCGYVSTADPTACSYKVRVKVVDNDGGSAAKDVTINVVDVPEAPSAPAAPSVKATKDSGRSLDVTWNEPPQNTGKPPITDYDIEYRKKGGTFEQWPHGTADDTAALNPERSAQITRRAPAADAEPLESKTQYEVRVRATNLEGTSAWSSARSGTTGPGNRRPSFDTAGAVTLSVLENTRSGQSVGIAVSASDKDSDRLTYKLEGPGKDSFTIASGGQIRTRAALNYEERSSYSLTVRVDDGSKKANSSAAKSVTVTVDDVREAPSAPAAPTVSGIPGSTDSVRVTWKEPVNTGPPVTDYDVHFRVAGQGGFGRWLDPPGADTSTIITGLTAGTRYEVQVRARSDEGQSDWSRSGSGSPNPDQANRRPTFSAGSRTFSVAENTSPGVDIGDAVSATDPDDDTLIYTLEGTDAASFGILSTGSGGQIQTSAALNYEEKSSYSVTVRVKDNRGGTNAVNVTIRVTDVDGEAPGTPIAPTVTAVSSTSLQVSWDAPDNTGPPINDYDYRYRGPTGNWTEVTNTTITGTTVTIENLTASTSYEVQVSAKNAEGASEWSNSGIQSTNAPGANNMPVFSDGTSATRSISASAQPNTPIGDPIRATDADSGDTLTYTLEGRDAANFGITSTTGQLLTKSGVTLIVGDTYTVTVAVSDTKDTTRIDVTINATAAPPNNPPVFSSATATRSVRESASAGTAIGSPVTATDADAGDTLTYTLEGTDAASFSIGSSSGQISTKSGVTLDADTKSTYTVTVVATDNKQGRATIAVTITVVANNPPVFSGSPRAFTVRDNASAGTSIGNPVTATDADSEDTLTYTLGGTSAASFGIGSTTGQIVTRSGVTLRAGDTHSVTVVATDGRDSATIAVTITVIRGIFGCATSAAVPDSSNTGLVGDCEALLAARNTLEGSARLNWSVSTPIQQWEGVYLRGTPERVTWIILRRRGLDGSIPAQLGQLSSLTILNFHSNALTGQIPSEIGNLTNLEQLLLHNNSLSGDFPNLSRLSRLKKLWFSGKNNRIGQGKGIPLWLNNLTALEEVNLWGNEMGGSIPTLSGLSNLKLLKLQNNSLTGNIPSWFGDMNSLGGLYLHANNLSGPIPPELGKLTRLRRLWLDRNQLTGAIPPALSGMTNLGTLNLHTNQLTGSIPPQLGNLSRLQHLALQNNQLTEIIPAQLSYLSEMTRLAVSGNQLSGPIPPELGALPKLSLLWIHNNRLTGQIPSQLGDLSDTLTNIKLAQNNFAANACIPSALANVTRNDYTEAGLSACSQ